MFLETLLKRVASGEINVEQAMKVIDDPSKMRELLLMFAKQAHIKVDVYRMSDIEPLLQGSDSLDRPHRLLAFHVELAAKRNGEFVSKDGNTLDLIQATVDGDGSGIKIGMGFSEELEVGGGLFGPKVQDVYLYISTKLLRNQADWAQDSTGGEQ